jgi:hypothetical protein
VHAALAVVHGASDAMLAEEASDRHINEKNRRSLHRVTSGREL